MIFLFYYFNATPKIQNCKQAAPVAHFAKRNTKFGGGKRGRGPAALLVQSRPTKKSFVHNFLFARAEFFLLKGKAIFLLGSALQRGRRAFRTARGQKIFYPVGSPSETPSGPPLEPFHFLPARSRFRRDLL